MACLKCRWEQVFVDRDGDEQVRQVPLASSVHRVGKSVVRTLNHRSRRYIDCSNIRSNAPSAACGHSAAGSEQRAHRIHLARGSRATSGSLMQSADKFTP
jgi:hypothetical protein